MKAKYIGLGGTCNRKHRWECPNCRANKGTDCRFNLSKKRLGSKHKCRFCGTELLLEK
jgi:rubredoxin